MLRAQFVFLAILLSLGITNIWSQSLIPKPTPTIIPQLEDNSTPFPFSFLYRVGEVKGMIRNKVIDLPKPKYPYEAISLDASGKVRVQVVLNEDGVVVSANASAGPESLRAICEETAKTTHFVPFRVNGQAVQTTGEIVYQFEIDRPSWIHIGYEIGGLATRGAIRYFPSTSIAMAFDSVWVKENEILLRLSRLRQEEVAKYPFELPKDRPLLRTTTKKFENGFRQTLSTVERRPTNPAIPTAEQIQLGDALTKQLRERLVGSEIELWKFNLGVELSTTFEARNDVQSRLDKSRALMRLIDSAPKSVDKEILKNIEKVCLLLKEPERIFDVDLNLYPAINLIVVAEYQF